MLLEAVSNLSAIFGFWSLLGLAVTFLYLYWWQRPHPRFPPGPRGIPLFGVILFFGKAPGLTMKKWSVEKYGPVMSVRFGREDVVVLNTFDAINQAFVKQSAIFSDRPLIPMFYAHNKNNGIVFRKYDETFKAQKHFALKFLRESGIARHKIEGVLNEEGDRFVEFLKSLNKGSVNFKKCFYWLTSNVISQIALGKRHEYDDKDFLRLLDAVNKLFADPKLPIVNLFSFLGKIPPLNKTLKSFLENAAFIRDAMKAYVDEHRTNFDADNIDDFIDAYLYEQQFGKTKGKHFSDMQLQSACQDLLVAGSETTSTTLCWCFVLLMNYSEYEKIIMNEIDKSLGSDGVPAMAKKEELPMTCAFIQECMRFKTLSPLAVQHKTTATTEVMGHVIPKGTTVIANLSGAHKDPIDWPNPEEFNPRRFIDENGKFVPSKKLIPFSVGARFCLGESLARAEIFIFFVKILQKFRVSPANGVPPDVNDEIVSLVTAARTCDVKLENRI